MTAIRVLSMLSYDMKMADLHLRCKTGVLSYPCTITVAIYEEEPHIGSAIQGL